MTLPLCVRIDADDKRSAEALRAADWREVEVLETWCRPIGDWKSIVTGVRVADPTDMLACQKIAAGAFRSSRLHTDPKVSVDTAEEYKRDWVCRAFEQTPQDVFVHVNGKDKVDGFLICKPETNAVRIDLIATADDARQKGVARNLIGWSHDCYPGRGVIVAGTQERNTAARQFYQKLGFRVIKRQRTFHK